MSKYCFQLTLTFILVMVLNSCQIVQPPDSATPSMEAVVSPTPSDTPIISPTVPAPTKDVASWQLLQEWKAPQCKPNVSPDWKYVIFVCSDEVGSSGLSGVYLAKWGSQPENWKPIPYEIKWITGQDSAWSPDSTRFTLGERFEDINLYKVDEPDNFVQLWDGWESHVSWSPDNQHVAVLFGNPLGLGVFSRDGEKELLLSYDEIYLNPKESLDLSMPWLPNGHQFLMFRSSGDTSNLLLTDVNTGESSILLAETPLNSFFRPGLSSDYKHLAFTVFPSKDNPYYDLNLETGELGTIPYDLEGDVTWDVTWSLDNRQIFGYERLGGKRVQLHVYDIKTEQEKVFLLPVKTYHDTEIHFDYFEMISDTLYHHIHSAEPEEQYALMRYNLTTGESTTLIAPFPGWKWKIIDRHENQWLLRLWQTGEHWKVLKQKLLLVSIDDENLLAQ